MNTLQYCVDRIDLQKKEDEAPGLCLSLVGWLFDSTSTVVQISFCCAGKDYPIISWGASSSDVANILGPAAKNCRFDEAIQIRDILPFDALSHAVLRVTRADGTSVELPLGGSLPWPWAAPLGDFSSLRVHVGIIASDPAELEQQLAAVADLSLLAQPGVVVGQGKHDALGKLAHAYNWHYLPQETDSVVPSGTLAAFYLRYVLDSDVLILLDHALPQARHWDQNWILGAFSFGSLVHVPKEAANNRPGADGAWWRPYRVIPAAVTCLLACSRTDIDYYGLPGLRITAFGATSRHEENSPDVYALAEGVLSLETPSLEVLGVASEEHVILSPTWRTELQSAVQATSAPGQELPAMLVSQDDQALFSRFISFGDNCEFGLVQRKVGLETLDLLRFGGTGENQDGLLRALQEDFSAFGTPEDVHIYEAGGEWISGSQRYGVTFHTHRHVADTAYEDVQASEQTKLRYLARKLLEDLEDGEKIIVRKSNRGITADEMRALLHGVRRHGGCPLLIVTEAGEGDVSGTVKSLGNGLYHGIIQRLAPYENAGAGSVEGWRQICNEIIAQL